MEEKFLKSRQEREELRANRPKDVSETTEQRQLFDEQVSSLEKAVDEHLQAGRVDDARRDLATLRVLVQDTASSISLTAYDMAKANSTLSRLQQAVDEKGGAGGGARKFKFSAASKKKVKPEKEAVPEEAGSGLPTATATVTPSSSTASPTEEVPTTSGTVYGPVRDTTLFIAASKAVFIRDCENTQILALPTAGSVFISNCHHCRVYVSCHQMRLKNCTDVDVYVWCASRPIIEACNGMRFGPYSSWSGLLSSPWQGSLLPSHAAWVRMVGEIESVEHTEQNFTCVDDFQWLKKSASPHWRVLQPEERVGCTEVFTAVSSPST